MDNRHKLEFFCKYSHSLGSRVPPLDLTNNLQNNEDSPWTLISAPICKIDKEDVPGIVIGTTIC